MHVQVYRTIGSRSSGWHSKDSNAQRCQSKARTEPPSQPGPHQYAAYRHWELSLFAALKTSRQADLTTPPRSFSVERRLMLRLPVGAPATPNVVLKTLASGKSRLG